MWPFLLGLVGWTALLLWGWIQVGRSLDDSVREEATAETRPEVEARPGGVGQHNSDDVITTVLHD